MIGFTSTLNPAKELEEAIVGNFLGTFCDEDLATMSAALGRTQPEAMAKLAKYKTK
ncbi:hypothetical protein ZHAS_00008635 [Anopheles sinensis]|uniref:Uncharacterized protein n=1 Tax=Anopheles sinensis TaxID=74873 RepID=A0A084VSS5_ANOSI|nr:hypothetical protein ZHAS_00008635 [Anopheles sinensis]